MDLEDDFLRRINILQRIDYTELRRNLFCKRKPGKVTPVSNSSLKIATPAPVVPPNSSTGPSPSTLAGARVEDLPAPRCFLKRSSPNMSSVNNFTIPEKIGKKMPWMVNPCVPPSTVAPQILSVVASVALGCDLDLEEIASKSYDNQFNKDSFTPLKMFLRDPYAVGMVFNSGSMVVTGTKSLAECEKAVGKFAARLKGCGCPVRLPIITVQNISASIDLQFKILLQDLYECELLQGRVFKEENFSGITIEMTVPKAKIILFSTGKGLITGVTREKELQEALEFIYPFARLYAK